MREPVGEQASEQHSSMVTALASCPDFLSAGWWPVSKSDNTPSPSCFCWFSKLGFLLLWRDPMITTALIKENISLGLAYRFRGLVCYEDRKHGSIQASMVLEELRVLHLVQKTNRRRLLSFRQLRGGSQTPPLQWHISCWNGWNLNKFYKEHLNSSWIATWMLQGKFELW